jgi:hypothetical protein
MYEGLWATHCEGAAQILKIRGFYDKNDEFERKLLLALRGSVVSLPVRARDHAQACNSCSKPFSATRYA